MKQSRRLEAHCICGLRQVRLHSLMSTISFQATALVKLMAGQESDMRWMVRKIALPPHTNLPHNPPIHLEEQRQPT
jgi:hypothetical protein